MELTKLADPFDVIQKMQPGTALFAPVNPAGEWEFAFLIREESKRIKRFGPGPRVEIRTSLDIRNGVALIPLLVQIGRYDTVEVYETWVNASNPEGVRCLDLLISRPQFLVIFFGDKGRERNISATNVSQQAFSAMKTTIQEMAPWSMAAFDLAREEMYQEHSSVQALWNALK